MKKNNHLQYKMFLLNLENFAELSAKKFYLQYIMFVFVNCNKYNTSVSRLCITCILHRRFLTICEMFYFYLSQYFENSTEQKMKEIKIKNLYEKNIENLRKVKILELKEMKIQDLKVLKVKIEIDNKEKK